MTAKNEIVAFRGELERMTPEFSRALPPQIRPEVFVRTALTAIQTNASILQCSRKSVWSSLMRAAQQGLLPDGREGAIVPFKGEAQWMPMVGGILKLVRNSGELKSITARVVYGGDNFRHWVDDAGEHILHESADEPDRNIIRRVYALALTKDGGIYIEVLDMNDIKKIRAVSRANKGPWVDWEEEMMKKSAIRRLSKRLPMSTDLADMMDSDDRMTEATVTAVTSLPAEAAKPSRLADKMAALASQPAETVSMVTEIDPETGEIVDEIDPPQEVAMAPVAEKPKPVARAKAAPKPAPQQEQYEDADVMEDTRPTPAPTTSVQAFAQEAAQEVAEEEDDPNARADPADMEAAHKRGAEGRRLGMTRRAVPPEYRNDPELAGAWIKGWDSAA